MRHDSASWRATVPGQPSLWDRLKFDLVAGSPEYRAMILRPEILRDGNPDCTGRNRAERGRVSRPFATRADTARHPVKCHVGAETVNLILTHWPAEI